MKRIGQFFFTFIPLLLVLVLQFAVTFLVMAISGVVEFGTGADLYALSDLWYSTTFNTWIMICFSLCCMVIYGLWYYMRYNADYTPSVRQTFHPLTFLGVLMLAPGLQYLSTYIVSFTASIFPEWLDAYLELLESAGMDSTLSVSMLVYSVLLAPVSEELIFRGVTLSHAKKFLPFWMANLFQAFLFGVFHMNMLQGTYAFCLGLFLGYLCEKGGNIYHSILLHMLFNFFGTVLNEYLTIGDTLFSIIFWFVFAIAMCVGGIAVFDAGTARRKEHSGEPQPFC